MSPVISIIVPSYNEEKNIRRCLDSILNQTFSDFEVLCVDDSSTDSTYDIIVEYSEKDSRIIPLKNDGKGVSSARNYGLKYAKGLYIGFVDSDDYIQPQMYEFLYNALIKANLDVALCDYIKTSDFSIKNFSFSYEIISPRNLIYTDDNIFSYHRELIFSSACMKLVNREILKDLFFESYKIGEDTVFCSKIMKNINSLCYIDIPLYCYYQNQESTVHVTSYHNILSSLITTRFESYEVLKNHKDSAVPSSFLDRGIKYILHLKFHIRNIENKKEYQDKIRYYFKKYIFTFLKCKDIKFIDKIYFLVFYYISPLNTLYRKKIDSDIQ